MKLRYKVEDILSKRKRLKGGESLLKGKQEKGILKNPH